jgi:hypothetical protein
MKDIGFTSEGNKLVEMSREEYDEFSKLCIAVEGDRSPWVLERSHQFEQGFDFTKTFDVIRAYYINKFRLNEFQELLNTMKESLEKESG